MRPPQRSPHRPSHEAPGLQLETPKSSSPAVWLRGSPRRPAAHQGAPCRGQAVPAVISHLAPAGYKTLRVPAGDAATCSPPLTAPSLLPPGLGDTRAALVPAWLRFCAFPPGAKAPWPPHSTPPPPPRAPAHACQFHQPPRAPRGHQKILYSERQGPAGTPHPRQSHPPALTATSLFALKGVSSPACSHSTGFGDCFCN